MIEYPLPPLGVLIFILVSSFYWSFPRLEKRMWRHWCRQSRAPFTLPRSGGNAADVCLPAPIIARPASVALFHVQDTYTSATMLDLYMGAIPFMLLQLIVMMLMLVFPRIALWLRELSRRAGLARPRAVLAWQTPGAHGSWLQEKAMHKDFDAIDVSEETFAKGNFPFYWITRVQARYSLRLEAVLKPRGLDIPKWRALMCLKPGTWQSVSFVSDVCLIRLNTATKLLQRMTEEGLILSRPGASDRRVTEVTLTEGGLQRRDAVWDQVQGLLLDSYEGVSDAERYLLNSILQKIFGNLE